MVKPPVGDLCTSEHGSDDTPSAVHIHAGRPPLSEFCSFFSPQPDFSLQDLVRGHVVCGDPLGRELDGHNTHAH